MPSTILSPDTFAMQANATNTPALAALRHEGWERFQSLPWPSCNEERWRFATIPHEPAIGAFALPCAPDATTTAALMARSRIVEPVAAKLVFANGHLVGGAAMEARLAARGVVFESLEDAMQRRPGWVAEYLLKAGAILGGGKLLALHQAYLRGGYVLHIPDGVTIEHPVAVYHWHTGNGVAFFPHALVVAGKNSRVDIVDFHLSADATGSALAVSAADIYAGEGAAVSRTVVQQWNSHWISHQIDNANVARDGRVVSVSVNLGARRARMENAVRLNGTGADARLYGLTVAEGGQEFDQRTLQIHNAGSATSDLLYKNALLDSARTLFSGLIRVAPGAQGTDAYQTNRNLLLSPEAEANSLPGLEIEANDVKCSHGATTGQLDPEELFYMNARGIPKDAAHELLVFGFFEEIINRVENPELATALRTFVQGKFQRRGHA